MTRACDLTGRRFGRLTVIGRARSDKQGNAMWLCRCDCGTEKVIRGYHLRSGIIRSCGCLMREAASQRMRTHGMYKTRLYGVWRAMKARCYDKKNPQFKNYGGRGISVCPEWKDNFNSFAIWAKSHGYDENASYGACTLDRIDPDKDYEPSNCRFADSFVQANNQRGSHFKGEFVQDERDKLQGALDIAVQNESKLEAERERYREKFGKCIDYADAIHALMDDEGMA